MIVKNESHIIKDLLLSVYKHIDYYVIVDTGSTDNTIDIIKDFFSEKNLDGEIHQRPWIDDFAYSRTEALNLCEGKSKYIWIIDADNFLIGDINLSNLTNDAYQIKYKSSVSFWRTQIIKNDPKFAWKYVGVLHEYLTSGSGEYYKTSNLEGDYYLQDYHLGDRSLNKHKYNKDAMILEKALLSEPNNERYVFYLAQSYFSCLKYEYAIINYKNRIAMGGWKEEIYQCYYQIGICLKELKKPLKEIVDAFNECHNFCKTRAEPLYEIALLYKDNEDYQKGYDYAKKASKIPYPTNDSLFIVDSVYDYEIYDVLSICAYYIRKYDESAIICHNLLTSGKLPTSYHNRILDNASYSLKKIKKIIMI
jgi:tetratricopeptide (TPR) repeat protein